MAAINGSHRACVLAPRIPDKLCPAGECETANNEKENCMTVQDDAQGLTGYGTIAIYLVAFDLIAAFGVIGWQALSWLQTGQWQSPTLITALASSGVQWASHPNSWIGIHGLLKHVPLSVAVFWTGMLPALLLMLLHNWTVRHRRN